METSPREFMPIINGLLKIAGKYYDMSPRKLLRIIKEEAGEATSSVMKFDKNFENKKVSINVSFDLDQIFKLAFENIESKYGKENKQDE